jgi:hypothetical protein
MFWPSRSVCLLRRMKWVMWSYAENYRAGGRWLSQAARGVHIPEPCLLTKIALNPGKKREERSSGLPRYEGTDV